MEKKQVARVKLRISKTKAGKEYLMADFIDNNGKRQRKSLKLENTPQNRKVAENVIIPKLTLALEEQRGEFFKTKIPTVNDYVIKSINMHRASRNEETHKDYLSLYENHIKEYLGSKKIDEIKPSHLRQWQTDLQTVKGLSASRVKTARKVLTRMFKDAFEDELIIKNPFETVDSPKVEETKIEPFTLDESITLIQNAEGQIQNFVATAIFTGARSGELLGLRWDEIDFDKKEISINRSIKMGEVRKTKTAHSVRTIDMLDSLFPYLKAQYELTGSKNSYVFLNRNNKHIYDIKRIRDTHWKNLLEKCKIKYRTIYQTRHTFASLMLANNEDILWVSKMLGHKDSVITLQRYAKYMKQPDIKRGSFISEKLSVSGS